MAAVEQSAASSLEATMLLQRASLPILDILSKQRDRQSSVERRKPSREGASEQHVSVGERRRSVLAQQKYSPEALHQKIKHILKELDSLQIEHDNVAAARNDDSLCSLWENTEVNITTAKNIIEGRLRCLGPETTTELITVLSESSACMKQLMDTNLALYRATKQERVVGRAVIEQFETLLLAMDERMHRQYACSRQVQARNDSLENLGVWCRVYVQGVMAERTLWQQKHGINPGDNPAEHIGFVRRCALAIEAAQQIPPPLCIHPNEMRELKGESYPEIVSKMPASALPFGSASASVANRFLTRCEGRHYHDRGAMRYIEPREELALLSTMLDDRHNDVVALQRELFHQNTQRYDRLLSQKFCALLSGLRDEKNRLKDTMQQTFMDMSIFLRDSMEQLLNKRATTSRRNLTGIRMQTRSQSPHSSPPPASIVSTLSAVAAIPTVSAVSPLPPGSTASIVSAVSNPRQGQLSVARKASVRRGSSEVQSRERVSSMIEGTSRGSAVKGKIEVGESDTVVTDPAAISSDISEKSLKRPQRERRISTRTKLSLPTVSHEDQNIIRAEKSTQTAHEPSELMRLEAGSNVAVCPKCCHSFTVVLPEQQFTLNQGSTGSSSHCKAKEDSLRAESFQVHMQQESVQYGSNEIFVQGFSPMHSFSAYQHQPGEGAISAGTSAIKSRSTQSFRAHSKPTKTDDMSSSGHFLDIMAPRRSPLSQGIQVHQQHIKDQLVQHQGQPLPALGSGQTFLMLRNILQSQLGYSLVTSACSGNEGVLRAQRGGVTLTLRLHDNVRNGVPAVRGCPDDALLKTTRLSEAMQREMLRSSIVARQEPDRSTHSSCSRSISSRAAPSNNICTLPPLFSLSSALPYQQLQEVSLKNKTERIMTPSTVISSPASVRMIQPLYSVTLEPDGNIPPLETSSAVCADKAVSLSDQRRKISTRLAVANQFTNQLRERLHRIDNTEQQDTAQPQLSPTAASPFRYQTPRFALTSLESSGRNSLREMPSEATTSRGAVNENTTNIEGIISRRNDTLHRKCVMHSTEAERLRKFERVKDNTLPERE